MSHGAVRVAKGYKFRVIPKGSDVLRVEITIGRVPGVKSSRSKGPLKITKCVTRHIVVSVH